MLYSTSIARMDFTALFSEGKSEALATLPNPQSSQRKILLVEDDPVNRELIRTYLGMSGLSAAEADTGQKAIKNCEQERRIGKTNR